MFGRGKWVGGREKGVVDGGGRKVGGGGGRESLPNVAKLII